MTESLTKPATGNIFDKISASAKKCFGIISKGSKESSKSMGATSKALGNIVLSMVAFQAISKATEYVTSGFNNLVQYSSELNGVFSDLKSQTATLKNSLATAFAPIVQQIIPYITKLVSWLNTAMDTLAQFWAFLSGKSTYTRAKKQVTDYASSIEAASKSAKGALASFDEINVLNKDEGESSSGGEVTGAGAFEEAAVDQSKFEWVNWLRENLDTILTIVGAIGIGLLAWKLGSIVSDIFGLELGFTKLLGIAMSVAGAVLYIKYAFDAWNNGVDWENLFGMITGLSGFVGGLGLVFGKVGAKIGAFVGGLGMIVIGIKDIIENGVNLENSLMVIAGVFSAVTALFGFGIGLIAALVTGLVLAIVRDWENFKQTVIEPLKVWGEALVGNFEQIVEGLTGIMDGLCKFVKGVFLFDWKLAWEGIKDVVKGIIKALEGLFKGFVNLVIGFVNTLMNAFTGVVNAIISAINSIDFTVPDWVPIIGGTHISPNLKPVTATNIPYLATGGTVTASTLAHLSENGRKEVVLPLEQNTEWADILADKIGTNGRPVVIRFEGSLAELGRVLKPVIDTENVRVGTSLVHA